jgi:LPXTG-motif cell wall-anchored protein
VNCVTLPNTGADAGLGLFLLLAVVCLVAGAVALLIARRRSRAATAIMTILLIIGTVTVAGATAIPAQAQPADCRPGDNSLTITQTSTMDHLAPGVAPKLITGVVINNSETDTHIFVIDVKIDSVTTAAGSRVAACDASDYVLLDSRMPVDRHLGPGESTSFHGASIGFRNKTSNQDACQEAVIHLHYTANPR